MEKFLLSGKEYIPLCDLLKVLGLCEHGGHAKQVISDGLVKVDNQVELRKRCKIKTGQIIEFDNQKVEVK